MENKRNKEDLDILLRVLSEEEFKLLKDAYSLYKTLDDGELKVLLLRRIDDVISMARFTDMSGSLFMESNYEHLSVRITNLKIAINSILNPESKESTFNYLADKTKTPHILQSIEYLDNQRHQEVACLLESVAKGKATGETLIGDLKRLVGHTHCLIYFRKGEQTVIYDIDNISNPIHSKSELMGVNERCIAAVSTKPNSTTQKIYDEMVYQAVNFNMAPRDVGYRLLKKNREER